MKNPRRFLFFIPVETQSNRRAVVIGYYLALIAFAIMLLWQRGPDKYGRLLPLTYFWAVMLGGFISSGPVRPFSRWQRKFKDGSFWGIKPGQTHSWLSGRAVIRIGHIDRLDEHDIAARDRAHYLAYSALRWAAIAAVILGPLFLIDAPPQQLAHILYLLSVPVAALFFSLPQAILLWTEPDLGTDTQDPGTQTVFKAIP